MRPTVEVSPEQRRCLRHYCLRIAGGKSALAERLGITRQALSALANTPGRACRPSTYEALAREVPGFDSGLGAEAVLDEREEALHQLQKAFSLPEQAMKSIYNIVAAYEA